MKNSTDFLNPQTKTEHKIADWMMEEAQSFYETALKNGDSKEDAKNFAIWAVKQLFN